MPIYYPLRLPLLIPYHSTATNVYRIIFFPIS